VFPIALPSLGLPGLFTSKAFNAGKEYEFVSARWQWLLAPWTEPTSHEAGFGAAFACLAPVALAPLVWLALARLRRGRLPAFALPLGWGLGYLAAWWFGTPHEPRHLAPLLALLGVPSLVIAGRGRDPARVAATAGVLFSTVLTVRLLVFSPVPELSARPFPYARLYQLPPALTALIPDGAHVANCAGRPFNFALLGPALTWRVRDFVPRPPTEDELRYHDIQYILYRGRPGGLPAAPSWRVLYRAPVEDLRLWETHPGDEVVLWRVR